MPDRILGIPTVPFALALAGLLPFAWGAITLIYPPLAEITARVIGPRFAGPYVQLAYGAIILSFMGGVLWGFATRAEGRVAAVGYTASVMPALWAFFFVGGGPVSAATYLIAGFVGILGLDWMFQARGLVPPWWLRLRLLITAGVVLTLLPIVL